MGLISSQKYFSKDEYEDHQKVNMRYYLTMGGN
jgi:hypothetical protein